MYKISLYFLFLCFCSCKNFTPNDKPVQCDMAVKGLKLPNPDSLNDRYKIYERLPKFSELDTIYRYEGHGGWGIFDYMCSIYRQKDTPIYKAQLLIGKPNERRFSSLEPGIIEKTLSSQEWVYVKKLFEDANFWCKPTNQLDYKCVDASYFLIRAKNGNIQRHTRWEDCHAFYKDDAEFWGLGLNLLELVDYPMPKILIYYKNMTDSVSADIFPTDYFDNTVKNYYIKDETNKGVKRDGIYSLTIHKKDFHKLYNIEMTQELVNGKVRTTSEKEFKKFK